MSAHFMQISGATCCGPQAGVTILTITDHFVVLLRQQNEKEHKVAARRCQVVEMPLIVQVQFIVRPQAIRPGGCQRYTSVDGRDPTGPEAVNAVLRSWMNVSFRQLPGHMPGRPV
jgi:hypothetical protein